MQARHTLWRSAGIPVPAVLGWSEEGLVALEALAGSELIGVLDRVSAPDLLLDAIEGLVAQIAQVPSSSAARSSLVRRIEWYEERLIEQLPASCRP